jgi:FMN hydrolase / 5-amino-6-(5-phospho-D-ribitylamino)uracil phosphatase
LSVGSKRWLLKTMPAIRAICFDLDNTLWDVYPVIVRAEKLLYDYLSERYPSLSQTMTQDSVREMRERVARQHPEMSHDFTLMRKQGLREHAHAVGLPETVADEAFAVFYRARNEVELYDDVMPALQRLGRGRRLVSMSNGNADLEMIGLKGVFEFHVAAREAGALKPDQRIYRKMLSNLGLEPAEVLHVGDDPVADIEGARALGMTAVWVNRADEKWPSELLPPPHRVRNLTELAELVERSGI